MTFRLFVQHGSPLTSAEQERQLQALFEPFGRITKFQTKCEPKIAPTVLSVKGALFDLFKPSETTLFSSALHESTSSTRKSWLHRLCGEFQPALVSKHFQGRKRLKFMTLLFLEVNRFF